MQLPLTDCIITYLRPIPTQMTYKSQKSVYNIVISARPKTLEPYSEHPNSSKQSCQHKQKP